MAEGQARPPLSDDELLALSNDPEFPQYQNKLNSEERRRLTRLQSAERVKTTLATGGARERGSGIGAFVGELQSLNPIAVARGVASAASDIPGTVRQIGQAQGQLATDTAEAFKEGDYLQAARKGLHYLIPVLGPQMDVASEELEAGNIPEGLGKATDVGLQVALPSAVGRIRSVPLSPRVPGPTTAEGQALAFGQREGIPIDTGTASGSNFYRRTQQMAASNPGGAGVAERFRRVQDERLATVGEQQAARAFPQRAVTPEQAGEGARAAVRGRAAQHAATADAAYSKLRVLETKAQPQTVTQTQQGRVPGGGTLPVQTSQQMRLAVDIRATKQAMQPIYQQLLREAELVPLQGDKARALTSLDRLMNAPDFAPLSVADGALGDLKRLARVQDNIRRTEGQGIAAEAVTQLEQAVSATARNAGPDVFNALMEGRAATVNKYKALDVLDRLREEPVQVYRQLTANKDAAVNLFRDVQKYAPDELPKLGRAWLDEAMQVATAEGGFARAAKLWADWRRMGPETKRLLFRDPHYIADLDSFFLLAKRIGESPNPSGTALSLNATKLGAAPFNYALAKLLYSPRGVRLLIRGARIPIRNKAAVAAWTSEALKAVDAVGDLHGMVPAAAETESAEESRR